MMKLKEDTCSQNMVTIKTSRKILLNKNGEMKSSVKSKLDDIMKQSRTHITCVGRDMSDKVPLPSTSSVDDMDIEIIGHRDAIERARILCLILLDELVSSLTTFLSSFRLTLPH